MPVDLQHPLYDEFLPKWIRARDVIVGEDRIKERGDSYLPRLDSQSDGEFDAYLTRASFYNATGRTLTGFSGMIFRRDPIFKLPEGKDPLATVFGKFRSDADLGSTNRPLLTELLVGVTPLPTGAKNRRWVACFILPTIS